MRPRKLTLHSYLTDEDIQMSEIGERHRRRIKVYTLLSKKVEQLLQNIYEYNDAVPSKEIYNEEKRRVEFEDTVVVLMGEEAERYWKEYNAKVAEGVA